MTLADRTARLLPIGISYFVAVAACVSLTRYDGGSASLWFASPLLIAYLAARPGRTWPAPLAMCLLTGMLAITLASGSWKIALFLSVGGLLEGVVGAGLLRRKAWRDEAPGTLLWMLRFALSVGLIAPLGSAVVLALVWSAAGNAWRPVFENAMAVHALSNLAFGPMMRTLVRNGWRTVRSDLGRYGAGPGIGLLGVVIIVTAVTLYRTDLPLLFLPILPIVLTCFRHGHGGAAVSILIVAVIGGGLTIGGYGPLHLADQSLGAQMQFLLFYLAALSLIAMPIAAELDLRAELLSSAHTSEARFRLFADYSSDILMQMDPAGRVLYASPSIERFMDFDRNALSTPDHVTFINSEDLPVVMRGHLDTLAAKGETIRFEYRAMTRQGEMRWLEAHSRAIVQEDQITTSVVTVLRDISERKLNEQKLTRDAATDPLTGLANRRGFEARIQERLERREAGQADCIAVFDIDHFKRVNDGHGHDAGDAVLQVFARVLGHVVRASDTVARIGGEEFAAHFPATSVEQALAICERLRIEMAKQTTITGGEPIRVTVSGGVASFAHDNLARALKDADQALYEAKRGGRNQMALAA